MSVAAREIYVAQPTWRGIWFAPTKSERAHEERVFVKACNMSHALVFLSSKHLANTVTSAKTERDLVYASQIRVVFGDLASKSKDARSDVCRKMEV